MPNTQSHVKSGRKGAAAKPIPSKIQTPQEKEAAAALALQGSTPVQSHVQPSAELDTNAAPEGSTETAAPALPEDVQSIQAEADKQADRRIAQDRRAEDKDRFAQFALQNLAAPTVEGQEGPQALKPEDVQRLFQQQMATAMQSVAQEVAQKIGITDPAILQNLLQGQAPRPVGGGQRSDRVVRNNITRPASGTKTGTVWDTADEISHNKNGEPASMAEMKAHPAIKGMNDHTLKTQYARWRAFHGVKGRVAPAPAQAQQPATPFNPSGAWGSIQPF